MTGTPLSCSGATFCLSSTSGVGDGVGSCAAAPAANMKTAINKNKYDRNDIKITFLSAFLTASTLELINAEAAVNAEVLLFTQERTRYRRKPTPDTAEYPVGESADAAEDVQLAHIVEDRIEHRHREQR